MNLNLSTGRSVVAFGLAYSVSCVDAEANVFHPKLMYFLEYSLGLKLNPGQLTHPNWYIW